MYRADTKFTVIIPARYASTRLPAKAMLDIAGKPMIQHVFERALESGAQQVVIATDDGRIRMAAEGFGAPVVMTDPGHASGTDRLEEAVRSLGLAADEIVVNLQGDEPLMPPELIQQVARNLSQQPETSIATLCERISDPAQVFNPHVVKVVFDSNGKALYFSRAPIPWHREGFAEGQPTQLPEGPGWYRHLGIYAYRASFLTEFVGWPQAPLEGGESLEQLRALYQGAQILVVEAERSPPPGVDTIEELAEVRRRLGHMS